MNLEELKKIIISSTSSIDHIINELEQIKENTIIVASGGSMVVACFLKNILENKNNIIAEVVDPRDLHYKNLNKFPSIFIISYSGSNFGVKASFIKNKKIYLLSSRKSKIENEILLHYELENNNSFISLETTTVPLSILLKYYLKEKFAIILNEVFDYIDEKMFLDISGEFLNIFSGSDTIAAEEFLTSTLTEANLTIPLVHKKYSYCHGRSTVNINHSSSAIYLGYNDTDLDKKLVEVLKLSCINNLVINSKFNDRIVNNYYFCLQCMILLINIATSKKINLRKIKYDREAVSRLYHFKGSM